MAKTYTIRGGVFEAPIVRSRMVEVQSPDYNKGVKEAPCIVLYKAHGASGTSPAYLYLGSGGSLRLSSTAPTGTSGVFTSIGTHVATVA